MSDRLQRAIEEHCIARSMTPWHRKEHDDLEPRGETVFEVLDNWMACRAAIFEVGLGQNRYGLTDLEVRHVAEHIEKWLEARR